MLSMVMYQIRRKYGRKCQHLRRVEAGKKDSKMSGEDQGGFTVREIKEEFCKEVTSWPLIHL